LSLSTVGENGTVPLTRRHAWLLFGIAAWNVVIWATFIKNLIADDGRSTGFYVAHTVLIVVDLVIAAVLALLGLRVWRAAPPSRVG
jgi:hypothetical protein